MATAFLGDMVNTGSGIVPACWDWGRNEVSSVYILALICFGEH